MMVLSTLQTTIIHNLQENILFLPPVLVPSYNLCKCHGIKEQIAMRSESVDVAKILARNFDPFRERLFTLTNPDTGVVELLVRLVRAFWVANL